MTTPVKIYYLGAGCISIPVLECLKESPLVELCGVGSQWKDAHRKTGAVRSAISPLARYCREKGEEIELHPNVNTPEFCAMLRERGVELLVVVSYGQLIRPALLETPKFGCLNVHASLLPRHRGASPIVAAMLAGDAETGVSFMKMEAGLDTGPVYRTERLEIYSSDTARTLEMRLGVLAGAHISRCIYDIARNGLLPVAQAEEGASYAGKITKQDGVADWTEPAELLERKVRAWQPWPSLRAVLPCKSGNHRKQIKITEAVVCPECPEGAQPGEILAYGKEGILVACGSGALRIRRLTPEGKREMNAAEYLLGSALPEGDHLRMLSTEESVE